MKYSVIAILRDALVVVGFVAFYYFVVPWIFPDLAYQAYFFSITLTVTNFAAVVISWAFFSRTRRYGDEANIVTMMGYKIFGSSATHMFIFIIRMTGNILAVVLVITYPEALVLSLPLFGFPLKMYLLAISVATALYSFEMINNIIATKNYDDLAKGKERSMMCKIYDDPLFCDF